MLEKLKALLKSKQEARTAKLKEVDKATDVAELRGYQTELEAIDEEIRSIQSMIDELDDDEGGEGQSERTAVVNGEIPGVVTAGAKSQETRKTADETEMEYRKAFQQYVTKGTEIPAEVRADANTLTTDIPGALPTVLVNRIVEKLETTGMILPLVNKTSFASGISIPTSSVKPVASWIAEGVTSDRQKKTTSTSITFTKHKLRCEISMSMETSTMALSAFEAAFERQVVEAMTKSIEQSIINGNGTSQPKGILTETPATDQVLESSELNYKLLIDAEAALPQAYENGAVYCMTKKTFMGYVGMVDSQKQPIARVNYGIGGVPERTLLGRTVVLCGDYMDSFSETLAVGKIFAFLFNFNDYSLNTIYDMGVQRKQDWDTEDMLTKAVMSVDGKVVDKNSLVTIKKIAAA